MIERSSLSQTISESSLFINTHYSQHQRSVGFGMISSFNYPFFEYLDWVWSALANQYDLCCRGGDTTGRRPVSLFCQELLVCWIQAFTLSLQFLRSAFWICVELPLAIPDWLVPYTELLNHIWMSPCKRSRILRKLGSCRQIVNFNWLTVYESFMYTCELEKWVTNHP